MKTLVFVTSFLSPHVFPLLNSLRKHYTVLGCIQTMRMTQERKNLEYEIQNTTFPLLTYQDMPYLCDELVQSADVVCMACGEFALIKKRIEANRDVFIMHERIFKKGVAKLADPRLLRYVRICFQAKQKNIYLLAIGEKSAQDFYFLGFPKEKIFYFGYFPDFGLYDRIRKNNARVEILWVGRMVGFKRPLMAARLVKYLSPEYHLTMIGDGKKMRSVRRYVNKNHLNVDLLGKMRSEEVKKAMQFADILLSTSNKGEGWGAVINEGMSCGCTIVCSDSIGCYGTLVDEENSCIFRTHSIADLRRAVCQAASNLHYYSEKSIETIKIEMNAIEAAKRFWQLEKWLSGEPEGHVYTEGICSRMVNTR